MMAKGRVLGASALLAAWPLPAAAQVASAASQAQAMVGKMAAAGLAIATLFLVIAGYFLMTGHGDRQTFALWATGFAVVVCAPAIVRSEEHLSETPSLMRISYA